MDRKESVGFHINRYDRNWKLSYSRVGKCTNIFPFWQIYRNVAKPATLLM